MHRNILEKRTCSSPVKRSKRIGEDLPEYEGCQVIDGTGRIVAPGFIDRHVQCHRRRR